MAQEIANHDKRIRTAAFMAADSPKAVRSSVNTRTQHPSTLIVRTQTSGTDTAADLRALDCDLRSDIVALLAAQPLARFLDVGAPANVPCNVLQMCNDKPIAAIADDVDSSAALSVKCERPDWRWVLRWHWSSPRFVVAVIDIQPWSNGKRVVVSS
jgi:hypothetical protein